MNQTELEKTVLSTALQYSKARDVLVPLLKIEYFTNPSCIKVCQAILALQSAGEPIDEITVAQKIGANGQKLVVELSKSELAMITTQKPHLEHHVKLLRSAHIKRKTINVAQGIANDIERGREPSDAIQDLSSISDCIGEDSKGLVPTKDAVKSAFTQFEEFYKTDYKYKTGILTVDSKKLFRPARLIVIAGRPAMGKTSFAMCLSAGLAQAGLKVAYFSLEMSLGELTGKLLCQISRVEYKSLEDRTASKDDWLKLARAADGFSKLDLLIDDTETLALGDIYNGIKKEKPDIVFIDYLQLLKTKQAKNKTREREVAELSRGLKQLAKKCDIPIVILAQLNRAVESRTVKRPVLSDLRESGAIEQDADIVLFIHRQGEYEPDNLELKNSAEFLIAKFRNGKSGIFPLTWIGKFGIFSDKIGETREKEIRPRDCKDWTEVYNG